MATSTTACPNPIALTTQAQALPDMHGSGWVRDLREAMSLTTLQGQALVTQVAAFAQATTKGAQLALLDDVIRLWADTNQTHVLAPADDASRRFDAGMQAPSVSGGVGSTLRTQLAQNHVFVASSAAGKNDSYWRIAA